MSNQPPQQPFYQPLIQIQQERNYTPAAWLSALLTFFFVVPGLIATIIYLVEANNVKKRTGITPQGYGCLWAVLVWCVVPPAVFFMCFACIAFAATTPHP